jgi:hypothetical protein
MMTQHDEIKKSPVPGYYDKAAYPQMDDWGHASNHIQLINAAHGDAEQHAYDVAQPPLTHASMPSRRFSPAGALRPLCYLLHYLEQIVVFSRLQFDARLPELIGIYCKDCVACWFHKHTVDVVSRPIQPLLGRLAQPIACQQR